MPGTEQAWPRGLPFTTGIGGLPTDQNQWTVTATEEPVVACVNPAGFWTDTVVDPGLSGVKLVVAVSEPPGIVTGEPIDPTAELLEVRFSVTEVPPANCSTNAKLLSVLS